MAVWLHLGRRTSSDSGVPKPFPELPTRAQGRRLLRGLSASTWRLRWACAFRRGRRARRPSRERTPSAHRSRSTGASSRRSR